MNDEILKLARECGLRFSLVCADPYSCPDDDDCCHKQVREGLHGRFSEIEDFYRAAFNAGLGAGIKDAYDTVQYGASFELADEMRESAMKLEMK